MSMISSKTRKPPENYTDEQWQSDFQKLRNEIRPSALREMPTVPETIKEGQVYHGKTEYQCYCDFINDILLNIRDGNTDYCFYIYQIADLLKYEHDRLQATWSETDQCFRLTLKNKTE